MMKRSTVWWIFGIVTMALGIVLGFFELITKEGSYFAIIMGFLATINFNVLYIEEKLK